MIKNKEFWLLTPILGFYSYLCVRYFWIFPAPSDQLEYVQSVQWGTTVGGYWPWLDRISIASVVGLLGYFPLPVYKSAPFMLFGVALGSLGVTSYFLNKMYGFTSALFFLILMISNYYLYHFGTEVFPEPFFIFFLLGTVLLTHPDNKNQKLWHFGVAGFLLLLAALCKIVVLPFAGFYFLYIWWRFKWKKQFWSFVYGMIGAVAFIILNFIFVYGFESLVDAIVSFYEWNFKFMLKGIKGINNIVSYYELFVDRGYLPVFLGLCTMAGLYRKKESLHFALISWILGGTVCFVYIVGDRPGTVVANYMYPMFFFASISIAIYWGERIQVKSTSEKVILSGAALLMLLLGWVLGASHNTSEYFDVGYYKKANFGIKALLQIGVYFLAVLPLLLELFKHKRVAQCALLSVAFFAMLYNGGRAQHRFATSLHPEITYYYENAPRLNSVPVDEFIIYNSRWKDIPRLSRLLTVYTHFFNEKFEIPDIPERQKIAMEKVPQAIGVVRSKDKLIGTKKEYILTDVVDEITEMFPGAKAQQKVPWGDYELILVKIQ